ncbi:MFS transporter [Legionella sp. CNM-1927-20]|uniref:MFS transporter n=1 Tax=Legionella sp. CNM-1927-20 TaxID=3422221 RepID=UPI00403A7EF4
MKNTNYTILPCLLAIVVDGMGFGLVYPIMTAMFTNPNTVFSSHLSINMRHFYLGLGYMLYPFCMFFGASFMGDLSDNWGRKKVILICMLGLFISFLLMGLSVLFTSIFLLMLGRAFSGLMAGSQPIAQAAIADISTVDNKAANMSIMTLALSVANVAGPLIGGVFSDSSLSHYFNFATPFFISATLALIAAIWIQYGFQETYTSPNQKPLNLLRPIYIFIEGLKHKGVRWLMIIFLLMQLGFSIYFQFILVLLHNDYHYLNWQLGAFNAFIGLCFVVSLTVGMRLMLRIWQVNTIAIICLFTVGIGLVLTVFSTKEWEIWLLAFPISAFDMIAYTALLTAFSDSVDKSAQGWVMGLSGALMAMAWATTGLSANLLPIIGTFGLILIGGFLLLVSAILMWFYSHSRFYVAQG